MTGNSNDQQLPHLPPRVRLADDPVESDVERRLGSPADPGAVHRPEAVVRRAKWSDYEEPELRSLRAARSAVVGSRIALAVWALSLVVAAALVRSSVADDVVSTSTVTRVGLVGVLLAAGAAAVGWSWTDRATQDVHRLGGRLPGRLRCVTAWMWPLASFLVLWVMVLQFEPTEPVDVRPVVMAVVVAFALWRPYSLVRRILRSLIRVDFDLAIVAGYLLDVALVGLLWARLANLPDELGPNDGGVAGVLLGLSAVAAIAAIGNVGVWYVLVRNVDRAVEHRRVAMRTRHQHRQLRLVGIDPLDPKVRRALMSIQQEAHRAELDRPDADGEAVCVVSEGSSEVDGEAARVVSEGSPDADDGRDAQRATDGTPAVGTGDAAQLRLFGDETTADDASTSVPASESAEHVPSSVEVSLEAPVEGARPVGSDPIDRVAARLRADREQSIESGGHGGASTRRPRSASHDSRDRGDDLDHASPAERLHHRLASQPNAGGGEAEQDRIERLQGRLIRESSAAQERSILDRLERLGITPGSTAVPDDGISRLPEEAVEEHDLVIERLYSLEIARYLLILATVVCAGASVWFVARSVEVGELVAGEIAPAGLDRLEVARLATVRALTVTLALVPLWCAVAARWANRVGIGVPGAARCAVLTFVSTVLAVIGIVADPDSNLTGLIVTACLGAALWSVPVMIEIERRFGRGTTIPSLLPLALGFGVLTAWVGRLFRPVAPTDSLEAMSFAGGLFALVIAIAAVVTAVASGDVVEAIKLSPAAPGRARRSRGDREDEAASGA